MSATLAYFKLPFAATLVGLVALTGFGFGSAGSLGEALHLVAIGSVLVLLEIALSFDNAVVNANRLHRMSPLWQRRFLTWGILIAVFGMRIVFPLAIVCVAAGMSPVRALVLALTEPETYGEILTGAHLSISAFGGTYLMMVALRFFIDAGKDLDWIKSIEARLRAAAQLRAVEVLLVLGILVAITAGQPEGREMTFLFAAILGLLAFLATDALGQLLDSPRADAVVASGGLGAFLYLEVLDASFSFDGVIGAFALTDNMVLMVIGLGVGACYVRAMTLMLVERKTLAQLRFLEHGAFYSVFALAIIMLLQSLIHVPEYVTGALSLGVLGLAVVSSLRASG